MGYSASYFDDLIEQELSKSDSELRKKAIKEIEKQGYDKEDAEDIIDGNYGSGIQFSDSELDEMSLRLRELIISNATQYDLPASVENDIANCTSYFYQSKYGGIVNIKLRIDFSNDLTRKSLVYTKGKRKGERTGSGITNIINLFNTGYESIAPIKNGFWETHGIIVRSTPTSRTGLYFLDTAIDDFLTEFPDVRDCGYDLFGDMSEGINI